MGAAGNASRSLSLSLSLRRLELHEKLKSSPKFPFLLQRRCCVFFLHTVLQMAGQMTTEMGYFEDEEDGFLIFVKSFLTQLLMGESFRK